MAARVGARLRPGAEADEGGSEPQRHERLAGLRLAQRLAAPGGTLLLFDEAEDLFVSRSTVSDEPVASSRVFIHRLLERLAVPVIWTANDIGVLGPAVLRRRWRRSRRVTTSESRVLPIASMVLMTQRQPAGTDDEQLFADQGPAHPARLRSLGRRTAV